MSDRFDDDGGVVPDEIRSGGSVEDGIIPHAGNGDAGPPGPPDDDDIGARAIPHAGNGDAGPPSPPG
ncbi:hypothetical protein THAOC_33598, partial [Thalassiosira oceanica]